MARIVRSGLIQCSNPKSEGSVKEIQEAMFEKHIPFLDQAAKAGVQILCLQEIFNGPYFCPSQDAHWYDIAEAVPGPTTELMAKFANLPSRDGGINLHILVLLMGPIIGAIFGVAAGLFAVIAAKWLGPKSAQPSPGPA